MPSRNNNINYIKITVYYWYIRWLTLVTALRIKGYSEEKINKGNTIRKLQLNPIEDFTVRKTRFLK